jgi:hypothetical protein
VYGSTDSSPALPPPSPIEPATGNARYVYLLTRLRSRQITMEEATELFALQQGMLRNALARIPAPPPRRSDDGSPLTPPTSGSGPMALGTMSDDGFALSLLALGAGAGVLAAVLKKGRDGDTPLPTRR